MASQSWVSLINAASPLGTGAGATLTTGTTQTRISPTGPAGAQDVALVNPASQPLGWYPGLIVRVIAHGYITTTTTSSTLTMTLRANLNNAGSTLVNLAATAALTGTTTAATGLPWRLETVSRCTAIASSGNTVSTQGTFVLATTVTPAILTASATIAGLPSASGETAAAVDTTSLQGLGLWATPGTSAGLSAIACTDWLVEALD